MSSIIEINQFNVNTGIVKKQRDELHSNTKWHKIIVENVEKLSKVTVLNVIMKFCYPLHFIPVHYQPSNNTASFLLKNCGAAIERMCNQNLIIKNPFNFDKPFKIAIQLSTANTENFKVNIQDNVTEILNRRYNKQTGVLNLENFVNDSNLEEFCPLSQPKLLFYILHISKTIPFKHLKLCNNEIESLKPMEALVGINTLISIDLRNNSIPSMAEIIHMQDFHLRELWLDGNPLCDKFDEFTYGRDAKRYLNTLEKLDGVNIQQKGFLPFRRNFLCSQTGYDLVDQFLEHYFTLYDAQNRSVLDGLYHKEAQFSLTSNYLSLQSTSIHARLRAYNKISRNILQMQDSNKIDEFLFAGPYDIIKLLSSLPPSEHDPFSFTVDLITYTEKLAILVVSGVFREIKETLFEVERLLNFTRTFVLLAGADREYTILNEMVHISNATTTQASTAFQLVKPLRSDRIHIPQPKDAKEMLQIVETVKILTGMNMEWSKKCLEECNYNLERALTLFVELYKMDKMPDTAFNSENRPGAKLHPQFSLRRMLNSGSHLSKYTKRNDAQTPMFTGNKTIEQSSKTTGNVETISTDLVHGAALGASQKVKENNVNTTGRICRMELERNLKNIVQTSKNLNKNNVNSTDAKQNQLQEKKLTSNQQQPRTIPTIQRMLPKAEHVKQKILEREIRTIHRIQSNHEENNPNEYAGHVHNKHDRIKRIYANQETGLIHVKLDNAL